MRRRSIDSLRRAADPPTPGTDLLFDACVYIDVLQGWTPTEVDALLQLRTLNHLSVCVAELAQTIADIPLHRLATSSANVVLEAGILAGLVLRLGGFAAGQNLAALNDATLYLHAVAHGPEVLTRNVRDFDMMQQILPEGRVLFYQLVG
jgi:hypothetical protein